MILRFARLTLALVLFVDLGCSNFIRTGWQPDIAVRPSTAIVVWAAPDPDKKDRARVFGIRFDTGEDAVEPRRIDPVPLQLSPVKFVNSPKVTPCGENRILVTWISGDGLSDERLVGRFLTSTFGELIAGSDGPGSGIFEIGEPQIHKLPDRSAFDYDVDFDPVHARVIVAWHQPLNVIECP